MKRVFCRSKRRSIVIAVVVIVGLFVCPAVQAFNPQPEPPAELQTNPAPTDKTDQQDLGGLGPQPEPPDKPTLKTKGIDPVDEKEPKETEGLKLNPKAMDPVDK